VCDPEQRSGENVIPGSDNDGDEKSSTSARSILSGGEQGDSIH